MNVTLVSSNTTKHLSFNMFLKYNLLLSKKKINICRIIVDLDKEKPNFIFHLFKLANRQVKYNGNFVLFQIINIIFYVAMTKIFGLKNKNCAEIKSDKISFLDNINSDEFVKIIKENKIDVVCLLGTKIVRGKILNQLKNVKFINIHSGDPSKYRGQPAYFWEILDKKKKVQLTIHEATKKLDSGRILNSKIVPIEYSKNLFFCISNNNRISEKYIFDLFYDSLIKLKKKKVNYITYIPSKKIMVIPSICNILKAQLNCLKFR